MRVLSCLVLLASFFLLANGLIHDLTISKDNRKRFLIENFGFEAGGEIHLQVLNFKLNGKEVTAEEAKSVGFLIKRTNQDSTAFVEEMPLTTNSDCPKLFSAGEYSIPINDTNKGVSTTRFEKIPKGREGFYNTYFINCHPGYVSFELLLTQYNVNPYGVKNYLSVGYYPLPTLFSVFTVTYFVMLIVWIFQFLRKQQPHINKIHHLMTVLVILKMLSLLFKTLEYHYIQTTGSGAGWQIVYYIFSGLKGIMLFVLIALIGTGWSFIKPFLSEKDKKIFLIVIPLQLLDNIALIIIEESAPGSQKWFTWKDIFRLVDIICCGAILVPIIWSIKHLREASQIDGKAAINMRKLQQFRQFYLMVVSYIYFTRIIVYLVDATLTFKLVWLGDLFTELATLAFLSVTGYKFRPMPTNPYFTLEEEEELKQMTVTED